MPSSRLGCPLSLKTPNMGNTGSILGSKERLLPKTPEDTAIEAAQECLKQTPVIVLGSGASIPFGLPSMSDLSRQLLNSNPNLPTDGETCVWKHFITKLQTQDLESTLSQVDISDALSDHIINQTWKYINDADQKVLDQVILNRNLFPLTRLYKHLFDSTNYTVSVVTTNYDRLAEYAADCLDYQHYTGFTHGYFRHRQTGTRPFAMRDNRRVRTVDIWKVHGCIDWFANGDNQIFAVPLSKSIPQACHPAIVTPGVAKYERTHQEPFRSVISGADNALMQGKSYLCIGYGFNDDHIQPKLEERWEQGEAPLVILTKKLTESVKKMLAKANGQQFLALEATEGGTKMWSNDYPDGHILDSVTLWKLEDFLNSTA